MNTDHPTSVSHRSFKVKKAHTGVWAVFQNGVLVATAHSETDAMAWIRKRSTSTTKVDPVTPRLSQQYQTEASHD